ncbi:MAG: flagellar hook assembly protein FlgD [Gammaproteobacteria bacterium]|nr:flagellar hook assembly protein FlgD [Gammaproteobacteria bacterium]
MVTPTQIDDARIFAPPPQQRERGELGQEDFLTLMITQFRNQDPFEPMDNGEFLGQLAQFSTVSGIDSLNGSFSGLAGALRDEQALQAANLVGRTVLAETDSGYFDGAAPMGGAVDLGAAATSVQIDITDASGQLVRSIDLGQQAPGTVRFDWDGRNADGDLLDAGHYQISARVVRGSNVESARAFIRANIESVTLGQFGGAMTLNLAGGESLSLSQVYQIT